MDVEHTAFSSLKPTKSMASVCQPSRVPRFGVPQPAGGSHRARPALGETVLRRKFKAGDDFPEAQVLTQLPLPPLYMLLLPGCWGAGFWVSSLGWHGAR